MINLSNYTYSTPDLVAACDDSKVGPIDLANWRRRGYFAVHSKDPNRRQGAPLQVSLLHVFEAVILATASKHGLPIPLVAFAFKRRVQQLYGTSGWAGAAEEFVEENLPPEFVNRNPKKPWFWILHTNAQPDPSGKRWRPFLVGVNAVNSAKDLHYYLTEPAVAAHVLNITEILKTVDEILAKRIADR